MILKFKEHEWQFPGIRVMGILNTTPDSFFDGGSFIKPADVLAHAARMVEEGADLIDIGGESTRPNAKKVSLEEELDRVLPAIRLISGKLPVPVSIDTTKASVARAAVAAGASIINDVSGGREEPEILNVAAQTGASLMLMHSRGNPQTMQALTDYSSVVDDVIFELKKTIESATAAGVHLDRIVIDPGFGFAKNTEQNLQILRNLERFKQFDHPLLVGISRKSFLGTLVNKAPQGRLAASLAAQFFAMLRGADIIRTHDVAETVETLKILKAILATRPSDVP